MTSPTRRPHAARTAAHLLILLLSACSAHDVTAVPSERNAPVAQRAADRSAAATRRTDVALRRRLERAAAGLLYTSESDYPFTWFQSPAPVPVPLDIATVRAVVGADAGEPIETVTLDQFFARHIERVDPADAAARALVPRYRRLRETLRHAIPGVQVFRVGRIRIRCYLIGTDRAGSSVVGLYTESIET